MSPLMGKTDKRHLKKSRKLYKILEDKYGWKKNRGGDSLVAQLRICLQCRRPWVGKIPWRRAWQPIPLFLPGESHGQRSLVGYSPRGHKESDITERLIKNKK